MKLAGASVPVFQYDAVKAIAQATSGVPRRIDRIAHLAHLALAATAIGKRDMVNPSDIQTAFNDTGP